MNTFSLSDIKKKNLFDVYHFIYSHPCCSKQSVANALEISLPTVSQHLSTLLDEALIQKAGQLTSSVGRRATAYKIVPTARIAVGIEILSRKIYITALNLYGKKETKEKHALHFRPDPAYFEELGSIVKEFLARHQYKEEQILGIGLGIQGLASPDGAFVTYGKILNCTGLTIDAFADCFFVPCRFIHDAECASNSELWENPEIGDAIYLSIGQHLGGAIIMNGELQKGLTGKSGTFEHMTLIPDGAECYCGKSGCAECYCSGSFLMGADMDPEVFFEKKMNSEPEYEKKWEEFLWNLSLLINNLHMVLENTVILGGNIASFFTSEDIDTVQKNVWKLSAFPNNEPFIIQGKCRTDAVSTGAAIPFIKEFLKDIGLQEGNAHSPEP